MASSSENQEVADEGASGASTKRTAELGRGNLRVGLFRYGAVVASVALATLLRYLLNPIFHQRQPYTTYFLAIVFSAWIAGWSGGLLAVLLSITAAAYFFIPPHNSILVIDLPDQVALLLFVVVGIAICAISDAQHKAHKRSERSARASRRHELALAASEKRNQAILDSTTDGLLLSDMTGHIISANPAAAHILGLDDPGKLCHKQADLVKQFTVGDLQGNPLPIEEWPLSRALRCERFSNYEVRVRRLAQNDEIYASYSGSPVLDENGQPQFAVVTLRDITDLKLAQVTLARAFERESLLNRIGEAIRASLDPVEIEELTSKALGEALAADRCFFISIDRPHRLITVSRDWRIDGLASLSGSYSAETEQIAAIADLFRKANTLRVKDLEHAEGKTLLAPLIAKMACRSVMMVPLYLDAELSSVLIVATKDKPRAWSLEEELLAEAVAAQSRSAVQSLETRQKEHRIATTLQEALQPSLPSNVEGLWLADHYTAALDEASVGGDFYDVFDLEPGLWALVIGDVSGKGLMAAAQVAMLRNMLRAALYQGRFLAEAVTTLNRIVTEHELLTGFVTLFVGIYREQTGNLMYTACGQEPAFLYRAASGEVETLGNAGPPIGVDTKTAYTDCSVRLAPGDTLLLYTDGLTESGPDRAHMLGVEGLQTLFQDIMTDLGADAADVDLIRQRLIDRVEAYAAGALSDDACLLLAQRKNSNGS
jgi:serine phosphatase RsbU (regulator of sigma subunit)/PAS domain-containing protein